MLPFRFPPMHGRTREQVWNHYVVESDIARRLKAADHEQRKAIYASMYDELFARVPDHPRLTRRTSPERTARANRNKMALLGRVLAPRGTVLEFAPGDCRFAAVVAGRVGEVIGVAMRTPHAVSGPWDVSRHFCEHPEGFHLKEWTVTELRRALLELGYRRVDCYWGLRSVQRRLPFAYFQAMEALLQRAPRGLAQRLARVLLPSVTCFAYR